MAHGAFGAASPHAKTDASSGGGAGGRNFGVGVSLFCPTGLSLKYMLHSEAAVDGAAGWSDNDINLHADYLIQNNHLMIEKGWSLNLHYGIGSRLLIGRGSDDTRDNNKPKDRVGVRLPLGLDISTGKLNIELFGELAVVVDFVQETGATLEVALGARYYL